MHFQPYIVAGVGLISAQTVALVVLLFQRRRDRAAERSLLETMQTDRKQSEFLAREVSRRLITAQENERKRIAHDLHDDLNQRLAMVSVELELLRQKVAADPAHTHVDEIDNRVKELASDVHRLSFQLHPAKLDQLGLLTA
ncbi:MAG TPA: histidine kinase, partial [Candidatus Binatia bacterium]|nr:histidine kinase [Candidatus Binatia bacterium]